MEDTSTAPAEESHGHGEEKQSQRATYVTIFLILGFLTILEVFVPSVYSAEYSSTTKMLLLCTLAITKAGLVAAFFMHLKYETKWTRWIGMTPIYMGIAVILIMLESLYR